MKTMLGFEACCDDSTSPCAISAGVEIPVPQSAIIAPKVMPQRHLARRLTRFAVLSCCGTRCCFVFIDDLPGSCCIAPGGQQTFKPRVGRAIGVLSRRGR